MLSTAAYRAEKETEGDPADAIIWDELAARTREEGLSGCRRVSHRAEAR